VLNEILSLDERGEKYSVLFNTMRPHIYMKTKADNSIGSEVSNQCTKSRKRLKKLNEWAGHMLLP
jgi:hypothetical protein